MDNSTEVFGSSPTKFRKFDNLECFIKKNILSL